MEHRLVFFWCLLLGYWLKTIDGLTNMLRGLSGNLRPNLMEIEPNLLLSSNDPSTFPTELAQSRNFDKLWFVFDRECAYGSNTEMEIESYVTNLKETYSCLIDDPSNNKVIYYNKKLDEWSAFLLINSENENNDPSCIDTIIIDYDSYCLGFVEYEIIFKSQSSNDKYNIINEDIECVSQDLNEFENRYLWNLDLIDGITADYLYSHLDATYSDNVDLFVLDTGVLSTHTEFYNHHNIIHGLPGYNDSTIYKGHGTHMTGIIAGKNVGIVKTSLTIYEYPVCDRSVNKQGCFFQDIFDGCEYVVSILKSKNNITHNDTFNIYHESRYASPHRGVINLSFGGYLPSYFLSQSFYDIFFGPFEEISENGGILVAAGGNIELTNIYFDPCSYWPSVSNDIISVGNYNQDFNVAPTSNTGDCIDIYAPGADIYSAWSSGNDVYRRQAGTSAASATVSGIVTNLLSINPYLSLEQIRDILLNNGNNIELGECYKIVTSNSDGAYSTTSDGGSSIGEDIVCNGLIIDCDTIIEEALNPPFFGNNVKRDENECNYSPCECDYLTEEVDSMDACLVCNQNSGCSQCDNGFFKIDYDFPCMQCQVVFGNNCIFCSDFIGCQQCKNQSTRVLDSETNLWYCD